VASVEKSVWTDADFVYMGWHDAALHAVAAEPAPPYAGRLMLDLDYIIEWVKPTPPQTAYAFWLCPATLVFDKAADLVHDLRLVGHAFEASIDRVERSEPDEHGVREWSILGHEFTITVRATGFTQYLRQSPIRANAQRLTVSERGGISFDEQGFA
jgi:hypothetical protein